MTSLAAFLKAETLFAEIVQYNQSYDVSNCHAWMWDLDHKEWWVMKNGWFWTVVLDKTLESPLDYKEIQQVNAKGNQSWLFIGQTDAEAEAPILWPTDVKNLLIRKDHITGKDWRQEEKRTIEDEKAGWHHRLDEHEFEQAPGKSEGQGNLICRSPWVTKSWTRLSDWTTAAKRDLYYMIKAKSQSSHTASVYITSLKGQKYNNRKQVSGF